jgi:hypothetical protein
MAIKIIAAQAINTMAKSIKIDKFIEKWLAQQKKCGSACR